MLTKNHKRLILSIFDFLFSSFIWHVNASWGNTFLTCLILSITTFLIIFTPFEIYWSFRDIWFDRWPKLFLKEITISKVKIKIDNRYLVANLLIHKDKSLCESKNAIIIISSGFSDDKLKLQYFYYPLASQGYVILTYDARGIGDSKIAGRRTDFIKRIEDYKNIIKWVKKKENFKNMKIFVVGFSIGAVTVLSGSFTDKDVKKIIAISSISSYKKNLPKFNPLILFLYFFKGVKLFIKDEENKLLSPYLVIKDLKNLVSMENWQFYSNRVLLIHTRNDKVIKIRNFHENAKILELPEKNKLIFKRGGHVLKKNELSLVASCLHFFNNIE
ncbi:MAG: alpha/beta fold hydrolase [Promethearchaeota archaeon]